MAPIQERRRFPRLDSSHLISYTHYDETDTPDAMGMGKTLDLSQGGVTIQTHASFPAGTGLELVIAIEERLIKAKGRVIHSRQVEEELFDVGVCFTEIDEADRESLNQFFKKISTA